MGENKNENLWPTCCSEEQTVFSVLYVLYLLISASAGNTVVMKPMRLLAVFCHEFSHALACWLTCGEVRSIQVYENEGGVTRYAGGCRCLIIPAGYLGCSFWGMLFVILSGGRKMATFAASVFTIALVFSLCYAPNRLMFTLNSIYAVLTLSLILVEWFLFTPILVFVTLFYGVFIGTFAIFDIYDDLIKRTVEGSDAYAFYELFPCCLPRCVGLQWIFVAIVFQFFGLWFALVLLSDECQEQGVFECINNDLVSDKIFFWRDHH